ncbi:MAG: hypothetical protein GY696_09145 [Gammaproteobacteria bacterium]|nr:hypothetical protein [Gammaproteobacteria bacterium]
MARIPADPETSVVNRCYAVVYTKKRQRNRFPENCVEVKATQDEALTAADPDQSRYPALVYGPSRSSEGFRLFYLLEWLD